MKCSPSSLPSALPSSFSWQDDSDHFLHIDSSPALTFLPSLCVRVSRAECSCWLSSWWEHRLLRRGLPRSPGTFKPLQHWLTQSGYLVIILEKWVLSEWTLIHGLDLADCAEVSKCEPAGTVAEICVQPEGWMLPGRGANRRCFALKTKQEQSSRCL